MKRKIYKELVTWKNTQAGSTVLLIEGAGCVGKSYVAEEFAKNEYRSYILIDFKTAPKEVTDIFEGCRNDPDTLLLYLSNFYKVELHERETLFLLNDVQFCPEARAALKNLLKDGRYDYVETISLISMSKNKKAGEEELLSPEEEKRIKMHPLDFEEFLWAMEEETLMNRIKGCFAGRGRMGLMLHRKAMDFFKRYVLVGGMPQAVAEYVRTNDLGRVNGIKQEILELYRADIIAHTESYDGKVLRIFENVPSQLQKRNIKFRLSSLEKGERSQDYEDAMLCLEDSMIVNLSRNFIDTGDGLKLKMGRMSVKCYMLDTGLLIAHAFGGDFVAREDGGRKLLFDKLEASKRMIVENVIAQMLVASGHKLYFYSNTTRTDANSRMEIDFLVAKDGVKGGHELSPVEVKVGRNYTVNALNKFRGKFDSQLDVPYLLHEEDLKEGNGISFLPIYMTPLINNMDDFMK